MDESAIRSQVSNLLHRLWLWPIAGRDSVACHKCSAITYPVAGRPDLVCLRANVVLEVKTMRGNDYEHQSFAFSELSVEQRTWLTMYLADKPRPAAAFIALGTSKGTAGAKKNPRMLWVVPWENWLEVEAQLLPHRKSLPLTSFKGQKPREVQDQELNAMHLLERWALVWEEGRWHLPKFEPPVWDGEWDTSPARLAHPLAHRCPDQYWANGERNTQAFAQQWKKTKQILEEKTQ